VSEQRTKDPNAAEETRPADSLTDDLRRITQGHYAQRTSEQCSCGLGVHTFGKHHAPTCPIAEQRPSKDLLSRLRSYSPRSGYSRVMRDAADEIERLRKLVPADETPACRCVELGYTCPTCCAASVATACPPPAQMTSGEYLCPKCGYFHPPPDGDNDV
jgi:hypothetical protein